MGRSGELLTFGFVAGHESLDGLAFYVRTFVLHGEVEYAQRALARFKEGDIVDRHRDFGLTVCIQFLRLNLGIGRIVHAVINLERTALQTHFFVLRRGRLVVIIVVLMRRYAELIGIRFEYRRSEEVGITAVCLLLGNRYVDIFVVDILTIDGLFAVVAYLHTIPQLRAGNGNRAMIGDRIRLVIVHTFAAFRIRALLQRSVGQIERLAGLALGEQGSVTFRVRLGDLVLNREHIHFVLTRSHIRTDDDALLLILYERSAHRVKQFAIMYVMADDRIDMIDSLVLRNADDMRYIVALELKYHLQVIADVVGTQTEAQRFLGLYPTSGDTTDEAHLRQVRNTYIVQRFYEQEGTVCTLIVHLDKTIIEEGVSLFEGLEGKAVVFRHAEFEITRSICLIER